MMNDEQRTAFLEAYQKLVEEHGLQLVAVMQVRRLGEAVLTEPALQVTEVT